MRALLYKPAPSTNSPYSLQVVTLPEPDCENEALIRVSLAGICNTDIEIVKGYMDFSGVPGHEFVGTVERAPDSKWIGKRVVGEINAGCGICPICKKGDPRHCKDRSTLGIFNRSGAFAEFLSLPQSNLWKVPEGVPDEAAVFVEPLAAACQIVEQVDVKNRNTLILGDGKLAQLIARVLPLFGARCTVVGKHMSKLQKLPAPVDFMLLSDFIIEKKYDLVVEASGNPEGFSMAIQCTKPRGTIVLKSTYSSSFAFNPASIVIDEIQLIGSRCGRFEPAIELLRKKRIDPIPLITHRLSLGRAVEAFEKAQEPESLKVMLEIP